jgi:hypothetical protein
MNVWSSRIAMLGAVLAGLLAVAERAEAKCLPATARPLPKPAGKMFIAVMITCDDNADALRAFADLSTKFPDVLASTPMDVDELRLGAKGAYYRTLLGKPGPKGDAAKTCTMLKAAGYNWCRTMQY